MSRNNPRTLCTCLTQAAPVLLHSLLFHNGMKSSSEQVYDVDNDTRSELRPSIFIYFLDVRFMIKLFEIFLANDGCAC